MQGGFTAGAGTRDFCEVAAALPELYSTVGSILMNAATSPIAQASACRVEEPWLWAWRGLVSYTVPKIDVQVSAIMKSQPNVTATNDPASNGLAQTANFFQTNAAILAALGRPIAGGASTVTLDLARPGEVYPDRLNTVDMRFTKIIRIGRTRTNVGVDLYNLFNANTGTSFNQNFGTDGSTWLRPNANPEPALRALQRDRGLLIWGPGPAEERVNTSICKAGLTLACATRSRAPCRTTCLKTVVVQAFRPAVSGSRLRQGFGEPRRSSPDHPASGGGT